MVCTTRAAQTILPIAIPGSKILLSQIILAFVSVGIFHLYSFCLWNLTDYSLQFTFYMSFRYLKLTL